MSRKDFFKNIESVIDDWKDTSFTFIAKNYEYYRRLEQRFLCYFLCPPSAHRKKVGRLSPPLPKVGCKVPLHP